MGIFDLPKIHVFGTQLVNAPTANNDSIGPGTEITVTCDTERVQPIMYGMDPDEWRTWVMSLDSTGNTLRSQWNYFGDMTLRMLDVRVSSVQTAVGEYITDPAVDSLVGAQVHLDNAIVCDNNPEGFNTTQIFSDALTIRPRLGESAAFGGTGAFLSRQPTRAMSRGLNWSRNVSFHGTLGDKTSGGAAGASCSFQHSIEIRPADLSEDSDTAVDEFGHRFLAGEGSPVVERLVEMLGDRSGPHPIRGLTFRYNLHLAFPSHSDPDLAADFAAGIWTENPAIGRLSGTIAPWYSDEPSSGTMGRVLNPTRPIDNPYTDSRPYYLGPALASVDAADKVLTVDMSNTTPADGQAGKPFAMGAIEIGVRQATEPTQDPNDNSHPVTVVGEIDTELSRAQMQGYMYDLDYSGLPAETQSLLEGDGELVLTAALQGLLLFEPEHHVVLESECNYLEQPPPGGSFEAELAPLQGDEMPIAMQGGSPIFISRRGQPVTGTMQMTLEQWRMTPSGDPNKFGYYNFPKLLHVAPREVTVTDGVGWTELIPEQTDPGLRLFRFVPNTMWPQHREPDILAWLFCAESYATTRVLPYDDYSELLATGPTFDDIYEEIFKYYDLIFPIMNERLPMSDRAIWEQPTTAKYVKRLVDPKVWESTTYMPRSRDLSAKRRELLLAFCDAVIQAHESPTNNADLQKAGA